MNLSPSILLIPQSKTTSFLGLIIKQNIILTLIDLNNKNTMK